MGESEWTSLALEWEERERPDFLDLLAGSSPARRKPWLVDLAGLERALNEARQRSYILPDGVDKLQLNPTVELFEAGYAGLAGLLADGDMPEPERESELVLVWYDPHRRAPRAVASDDALMLAFKLVVEGYDPKSPPPGVDAEFAGRALSRAASMGLVLRPASKIRREPGFCDRPAPELNGHQAAEVFTIQFHITQACDLHCLHCYDRSDRGHLGLEHGKRVLDELERFCDTKKVEGQVTFTGGNPLMHPEFSKFYREAAGRGFRVALLANPTNEKRVRELVDIKRPEYFQVSLEGLEEHNDYIRGNGHYKRTLDFLKVLDELGIYSMVMLTLTRANMDQVLPLAEQLKGRADLFTFNRLSAVGEGASLAMAPIDEYRKFLSEYMEAAENNPHMGVKDGLFNILRKERRLPYFSGCAGFGCGAAFNFAAVLPDGEVHACRKFPSRIGNVLEQGLVEVYDSDEAARYRRGCESCTPCELKPVCGGCLAVASSMGLDPFAERDRYCFAQVPAA